MIVERQQQTDNKVQFGKSVLDDHKSHEEYKVFFKKPTKPSGNVLEEREWSVVISYISVDHKGIICIICGG